MKKRTLPALLVLCVMILISSIMLVRFMNQISPKNPELVYDGPIVNIERINDILAMREAADENGVFLMKVSADTGLPIPDMTLARLGFVREEYATVKMKYHGEVQTLCFRTVEIESIGYKVTELYSIGDVAFPGIGITDGDSLKRVLAVYSLEAISTMEHFLSQQT